MRLLLSVPQTATRVPGLEALLAQAAGTGSARAPAVFASCDPPSAPLGSGGGTVYLLERCFRRDASAAGEDGGSSLEQWLASGPRIVVHAGGQSRRLPSYAVCGKALLPMPLLPHWAAAGRNLRSQHLGQTLLSASYALLERLARYAPPPARTVVCCGDVYLHAEEVPRASVDRLMRVLRAGGSDGTDVDVICVGLAPSGDAARDEALMGRHGVFYCDARRPTDLAYMLQKPDAATQRAQPAHLAAYIDTGIWLLSPRAVLALRQRSLARCNGGGGETLGLGFYDMYGSFGCGLGASPSAPEAVPEGTAAEGWVPLASLRTCVMPLVGASFYHFGSNADVLASVCAMDVQQREKQRLQAREDLLAPFSITAAPTAPTTSAAPFSTLSAGSDGGVGDTEEEETPVAADPSSAAAGDGPHAVAVPLHFTAEDAATRRPVCVVAHHCLVECRLAGVTHTWVENSHLGRGWRLRSHHFITGVPPAARGWRVDLPAGVCVDVVPLRDGRGHALRPYGFWDDFKAPARFLGRPLGEWLAARGLPAAGAAPAAAAAAAAAWLRPGADPHDAPLFPCSPDAALLARLLRWMVGAPPEPGDGGGEALAALWLATPRVSAAELTRVADAGALLAQRAELQRRTYPLLADPALPHHRVFYQSDLEAAARVFARFELPLPPPPPSLLPRGARAPSLEAMHYYMFAARLLQLRPASAAPPPPSPRDSPLLPYPASAAAADAKAFEVLRAATVASLAGLAAEEAATTTPSEPRRSTHLNQMVWARCPLRIDVAGGWRDTPPFCVLHGGSVVNMAVALNGQPPVQVYARLRGTPEIVLRSTDTGAHCVIRDYDDLRDYAAVGSAFSIPKAALALAGFLPEHLPAPAAPYASLADQLAARFGGCGLELTLFVAVPMGSGLGTSSVVSGAVLLALSDLCGLGWTAAGVCRRVLALEQMLTSGGGWQDQYGALLPGLKALRSRPGLPQTVEARYLPGRLLTLPERRGLHLLYYTGLQRTAVTILSDVVRGMFLRAAAPLAVLHEMEYHAAAVEAAIAADDLAGYCALLDRGLAHKDELDAGCVPPPIAAAVARIRPWAAGVTLPGAGGGGYLYIVAKDMTAAEHIRRELSARPVAETARFVTLELDEGGAVVTRS